MKALSAKRIDAALLSDVNVYRKDAEWILRYPEEFYTKPMQRTLLPHSTRV